MFGNAEKQPNPSSIHCMEINLDHNDVSVASGFELFTVTKGFSAINNKLTMKLYN